MTEKQLYNKCVKATMKAFKESKEDAIVDLENNIKEITDLGGTRLEALQEYAHSADDGLLVVD